MNTADQTNPLIERLEKFGPLSNQDLTLLHEIPTERRFIGPGSHLMREDDVICDCAIITSGFAVGLKKTIEGRRQIVSLLMPGEAYGLHSLFSNTADLTVQAVRPSIFVMIPDRALQNAMALSPAISRAAFANIAAESAISREWLVNIGRRDARGRIAHFLAEFLIRSERQGLTKGFSFELPLTQDQIGDILSLTPVHVNRTFGALQSDGLIKRDGRYFDILNWNGLLDAGGFTERYLSVS